MPIQYQSSSSQLVTQFLSTASPQTQEIVNAIVAAISSAEQNLDMAIKWRRLTFALEHDFHHWICGIEITKSYVGIIFHFGGLLDDPRGKFKIGASNFLRKIEIRSLREIENDVIQDFIDQAVNKLPYFKENWKKLKNQG